MVVLSELWPVEVATVSLADATVVVGEAHLLGPLGFATRAIAHTMLIRSMRTWRGWASS